jgi:hypothetical protein
VIDICIDERMIITSKPSVTSEMGKGKEEKGRHTHTHTHTPRPKQCHPPQYHLQETMMTRVVLVLAVCVCVCLHVCLCVFLPHYSQNLDLLA